ncbi:hypothetical protein FA15DRAFT_717868 [Coprinopsis marcescibilis]|uniref:Uncharacterized protein n=1 Tax=Coprinopsis marcescibilis TaxID=230819 RepID=A0A5C3KM99_COPMA|nr:hypothetical protein FA15DRAFT_717868 [Coprinopsis marcescibilis]
MTKSLTCQCFRLLLYNLLTFSTRVASPGCSLPLTTPMWTYYALSPLSGNCDPSLQALSVTRGTGNFVGGWLELLRPDGIRFRGGRILHSDVCKTGLEVVLGFFELLLLNRLLRDMELSGTGRLDVLIHYNAPATIKDTLKSAFVRYVPTCPRPVA